jgi:hypothetical protein
LAKIYIVRSAAGEVEAVTLSGLKVVYAFEDKYLAESYSNELSAGGKAYRVEAIGEAEFRDHIIPRLREASVKALIFNILPGSPPSGESFSVDITQLANPRTFDFSLGRWVTAKESRRLRRINK